ncbi:hypothetical protein MAPG_10652 [Magnaporthiopsis poae ATCC 64411]|uniref:Alpha/beta hydrolase fold-3 domain-containing protein n=1 Tax=Magnaporthiopsis poae (strain ATCC 64411 / 73-15) TaxID=644358 RepID=A0A0C4ED59_MAGP6|nr:hypothetical protein MAPG_10652 [Magnaporthiopsis poae ATCC 64411]
MHLAPWSRPRDRGQKEYVYVIHFVVFPTHSGVASLPIQEWRLATRHLSFRPGLGGEDGCYKEDVSHPVSARLNPHYLFLPSRVSLTPATLKPCRLATMAITENPQGDGQRAARKVWQPLHPDVRSRLDPQYLELHDGVLQYVQPTNEKPWDPSIRLSAGVSTGLGPVPVGSTEDIAVGNFKIRVYTPQTGRPDEGWPVFIWLHGGGFALGDLGSDDDLLTRVCQEARCVVCTIGYRLAPEHKYPAAVEDSVEGTRWILSPDGIGRLGLDRSRVAIGGVSAGAHLAAATCLHWADGDLAGVEPLLQILVVPVVDNTALPSSERWSLNGPTAPGLTPERMLWYRRMWLKEETDDALNWDASIDRAPVELLAKMPRAFVAVAELDLLAPEGVDFADQMRAAGVEVEIKVFTGCPHALLSYAGWMDKGKELLYDCVDRVKGAFAS